MARTASLTIEQAEAAIGTPRGTLHVTADNRGLVRKWLVAHGFPALFAGGLSMFELAMAYNGERKDGSDTGLDKLRAKLAEARDTVAAEDEAAEPVAPAWPRAAEPFTSEVAQRFEAPNGHATAVAEPTHDIEAAIRAIAASVAPKAPAIDATAVRAIVADELSKLPSPAPRAVAVSVNGAEPVTLNERVHPCFDRVVKLMANGANVLLVGPAGCGKTHLFAQAMKALGAERTGVLHGSAGASESALTGWLLPADGGRFEYAPSEFVEIYGSEAPAGFLWDELDAFDPNMLLVANGALANGHLHIAHRRHAPCVSRGPKVYLMATANTYGTGANPMYSSRAALDAATLDRFIVVTMDYDRALEEDIAGQGGLTADELSQIWNLRDRVRAANLRRTISTRAIQKACIMKQAGDTWETIMSTLTEGWSKDEKAKAGA
jgi:cobaltochelatase CobS